MFKKIAGLVLAFGTFQFILALCGMLFLLEHGAAELGYKVNVRSPITFHAIDTSDHLARR